MKEKDKKNTQSENLKKQLLELLPKDYLLKDIDKYKEDKEYKYRYEKKLLIKDLYDAYKNAFKNLNTAQKKHFYLNIEEEMSILAESIITELYEVSPSICFIVHSPVKREIIAAHCRDRIIHHYIHDYIYPYLDKKLIYDCYSCRKGKGTHFGIKRIKHHIRSCSKNYTQPAYILQLDIKGYFMHINRELLLQKAKKMLCEIGNTKINGTANKYKNKHQYITFLTEKIILHNPVDNCIIMSTEEERQDLPKSKSLFHSPEGCGLPIGNLTSQLFSNLYLNDFDHFVKRTLKAKHYGRYVDDFYIIDPSKEKLKQYIKLITSYLKEHFYLDIHPNKIELKKVKEGVTFLGVHIMPHREYLKTKTLKRIYKNINKWPSTDIYAPYTQQYIISALGSYVGIFKNLKTYKIQRDIFQKMDVNILDFVLVKNFARDFKKDIYFHLQQLN